MNAAATQTVRNHDLVTELRDRAHTFPVPAGFTSEWCEDYEGWGFPVFIMKKGDDVKFIFQPGGSGTTNFKVKDHWFTFDRRGVDDSFRWKAYDFEGDVTVNLAEVLGEQLARIAKRLEFHETALTVPQIGHSVSPDALKKLKAKLTLGQVITFTPSGFGQGYTIAPDRKMVGRYGVERASKELEEFFDHKALWIEKFDCD